jgi:hypothetical protein
MDLTSPLANMSASLVLTTDEDAFAEDEESDVLASAAEVPESCDFLPEESLSVEAVAADFAGAGLGFSG